MSYSITLTDSPPPAAREAIIAPLAAFHENFLGPANASTFALLIEGKDGATLGGLWARCFYQWLFIELIFVPETLRGQGIASTLIAQAEAEGLARGCQGVWLDAFNPSALRLYQAKGFEIFGELPDCPPGSTRYFLRKRLKVTERSV
ncbi:MAG: GNAT family N-acetyltransferase [Acidocella sp.]|nr:GNAT family N-acetyltransferase [Acidocella sp.]